MKKITVCILVLSLLMMFAGPLVLYAKADEGDMSETNGLQDTEESDISTKVGKSAAGCAAGAVAGTIVVPAFGTILGCAAGVIAGLFFW